MAPQDPHPMDLGSTDLARLRTALSAGRTLMSWIRTALSMLAFGFTIFKFLHGLHEAGTIRLRRPDEPRNVGLLLAALGILSLIAGLLQYASVARQLGRRPWRMGPSFGVACAVLVLGLLIGIGILERGPL